MVWGRKCLKWTKSNLCGEPTGSGNLTFSNVPLGHSEQGNQIGKEKYQAKAQPAHALCLFSLLVFVPVSAESAFFFFSLPVYKEHTKEAGDIGQISPLLSLGTPWIK